MHFTPQQQAAIDAHAAALGMSSDEYVHHSAVDRATAWQCEQRTFQELADRRGCTVEELLNRGTFTGNAAEATGTSEP